jgi:hypothetical protein
MKPVEQGITILLSRLCRSSTAAPASIISEAPLLRSFENLLDPFPPDEAPLPPKGLAAFLWACTRGLKTATPPNNPAVLKCEEQVRALPEGRWAVHDYQCEFSEARSDQLQFMARQLEFVRQNYPNSEPYSLQGKYTTEGGRLDIVDL